MGIGTLRRYHGKPGKKGKQVAQKPPAGPNAGNQEADKLAAEKAIVEMEAADKADFKKAVEKAVKEKLAVEKLDAEKKKVENQAQKLHDGKPVKNKPIEPPTTAKDQGQGIPGKIPVGNKPDGSENKQK